MERLTKKDFESDFCLECQDYGEPNGCNRSTGTCDAYDFCGEVWDKLAAYEDTGLTPEAINQMNDFINSQCAKLLEKNTALQAENERLKESVDKQQKYQQLCDNGILRTLKLAGTEMTRLQARAEALERAIYGTCEYCTHLKIEELPNKLKRHIFSSTPCENCTPNKCCWQFDEARFTGGERE